MKLILCATDFSDAAEAAEREAARLAGALGADLVLLHVASEAPLWNETLYTAKLERVFEDARRWAESALATRVTALGAAGVSARALVRVGVPWQEILATADAERADLIVMGTHGRSGLERAFLGSVAERVLRHATRPVLTVRPAPSAGASAAGSRRTPPRPAR